MHILIDDERGISEVMKMVSSVKFCDHFEFDKIIRTFEDANDNIINITADDVLYIDHDLGTDVPGKDGYGFIKSLRDNGKFPRTIIIVSANPIGLSNIENVIIHDMKMVKIADRVYSRSL